jgi:hypothetical protein
VLGRLALVGVAWITALGLFAALLQWSGSHPIELADSRDGVSALARSLNETRRASTDARRLEWTVTGARAAMHAMVIDVDAARPDDARAIAMELVPTIGKGYEEVLVYVSALDTTRDPVVRRVGWTPHGGYVESSFK